MESWKAELVRHILEHGDSLEFTKHFWKGCEPLEGDVVRYYKFCRALRLADGSMPFQKAAELDISVPTVGSRPSLEKMPKLGHYLRAFLSLGAPGTNRVWLVLESSHGYGIPVGQFIQVPGTISEWKDIEAVLLQIRELDGVASSFSKEYLFGFMLGIILGDCHKPKQGHGHRHIDLVLSKRYGTSQRIGDFTCLCVNTFGLRMRRRPDIPKPKNKPNGFYHWVSQSSPLVDWVFEVCLGLRDGQNTTYYPVFLDWALNGPVDFRIGLLQGIAESDGSVAVSSQTVEFWVLPDSEFMIKLLATFGLRGFRNREAVSLVKSQAIAAFSVPAFSPHLQTVRYQKLKLMATATKLRRDDRIPQDIRAEIQRLAKTGLSVPKIVEAIAEDKNLLISFEAAQRWRNKRLSAEQPDIFGPST